MAVCQRSGREPGVEGVEKVGEVNDELDGGGRASEAGKDSVLVEYGIK